MEEVAHALTAELGRLAEEEAARWGGGCESAHYFADLAYQIKGSEDDFERVMRKGMGEREEEYHRLRQDFDAAVLEAEEDEGEEEDAAEQEGIGIAERRGGLEAEDEQGHQGHFEELGGADDEGCARYQFDII
jgi:hypothetical protein